MVNILRVRFSLMFSLVLARAIHLFIANAFVFTFHDIGPSVKPAFVFLGSFLRPEDVSSYTAENSSGRDKITARKFNLDIRAGSISREFDKPDLLHKVGQPEKYQFKPALKQEAGVSKSKVLDSDDLGIDLAPFTPVRMQIDMKDTNDHN